MITIEPSPGRKIAYHIATAICSNSSKFEVMFGIMLLYTSNYTRIQYKALIPNIYLFKPVTVLLTIEREFAPTNFCLGEQNIFSLLSALCNSQYMTICNRYSGLFVRDYWLNYKSNLTNAKQLPKLCFAQISSYFLMIIRRFFLSCIKNNRLLFLLSLNWSNKSYNHF